MRYNNNHCHPCFRNSIPLLDPIVMTLWCRLSQIGVATHQRHSGLFAKEMAVPGVQGPNVHGGGQHRRDHRPRAGLTCCVRTFGGRGRGRDDRRSGRAPRRIDHDGRVVVVASSAANQPSPKEVAPAVIVVLLLSDRDRNGRQAQVP